MYLVGSARGHSSGKECCVSYKVSITTLLFSTGVPFLTKDMHSLMLRQLHMQPEESTR
jgi:hypothetical protein